jgi:hypothetical protein
LDNIDYYGEARDLLTEYLSSINLQWGPSRMLRDFLDMIPEIVNMIERNPNKVIGSYFHEETYLST